MIPFSDRQAPDPNSPESRSANAATPSIQPMAIAARTGAGSVPPNVDAAMVAPPEEVADADAANANASETSAVDTIENDICTNSVTSAAASIAARALAPMA